MKEKLIEKPKYPEKCVKYGHGYTYFGLPIEMRQCVYCKAVWKKI